MTTTTEPYQLTMLWHNGAIVATQFETKNVTRDEAGAIIAQHPNPASPLPLDLGAEVLGEVNAGLLAQIAELQAALITQAEQHAAEIAALQNPGAATAGLAQQLATVYNTLPEEVQAAFAKDYASVAILLDRGLADLARSVVAQLDIPAELEPVRTQILAALAE